jgi:CheY-like chemotaxis protein
MRVLRVLLVDDDEDHTFLIRRALRDIEGVTATVEVAETGEAALERLRRSRLEPDTLPELILLDLKMPRMGGFEVLRSIRGDTALRALPVVVLTSSERSDDREQALRLGVDWYVSKPLDGARFRAEVQQVAARWARGA